MVRFTFTGWNLGDWLKGVPGDWKQYVKLLLPLLVFWTTTGSWWQTALGAVLGKAVLDVAHYWLNK